MTLAKTKPLKLQSNDGDLKRLSDTEENYLAYLVGSHLIEDDSDAGNLTLNASGNTSIGSFVDTFFNEVDGTHPASSITSGSTTTTLYQVAGTADETDSDFRRPVAYDDGVRTMADSDLNILVARLNGRIAQSDYLGQFALGTSPPSGDYNLFIGGVFSDTVNDSTVNTYNIYRRETQSAPTGILDSDSSATSIMSLKLSNGDSGDFEGIQRMTERQVKISLGQRAKTLRAVSGAIGSYQLRSSSEGAPSTGSWRALGTATNTKKDTAEISYTRNRASTFTQDRVSTFTRVDLESYSRNFLGNFVGNYSRNFTSEYTGNYSRSFTGNYSRNFSRGRVSTFTRVSTRTLNYQRDSTRTSTRSFIGNYTGQRTISYTGNFTGNYTRSFTGNYSRTVTYTGNYSRTLTFTRDSTRDSTRTSTRFGTEGPFYDGISYSWQEEPGLLSVTWNGIVVYSGATGPTSVTGNDGATYNRGALQFAGQYAVSRTGTISYTGNFIGNFIGNYTRVSSYSRTRNSTFSYSRSRISSYTRTATASFIGNFVDDYTRTRVSTYGGNFVGDYTRTGYYTGNYSRTFTGEYSRDFTRSRTSTYTRTSTRDRVSAFSADYTRTRTSSYVGDYTGNYSRVIVDEYIGNVVDSYIGTTIQPTTSVIETYTLYVRYA